MSRYDQLREQIDACRPGSRDLSLPALAELSQALDDDSGLATEFARSQSFDKAIGAALADVPVPPGMIDRLLAATADAALAETPLAAAVPEVSVRPVRWWRNWSRRHFVATGALALSLLIGLVALYQGLRPAPLVSQQQLSGAVQGWLAELKAPEWKPLVRGAYPPGIEPDIAVRAPAQRSQSLRFSSPAGWSANVTAIDIASPGRQQAVLFVVRSSARFSVPPIPTPTKGLGLSGRMRAIAWQRLNSPWLYVLAVEETPGQKLGDYIQERSFTANERPAAGQPL
jgi:hypothetical protein